MATSLSKASNFSRRLPGNTTTLLRISSACSSGSLVLEGLAWDGQTRWAHRRGWLNLGRQRWDLKDISHKAFGDNNPISARE